VANWLGERVGVTFNDEEDDSIPVETLKELRNYVSLSGEPVFQLQVTGPGMFQSMQDYSTHWIIQLEPLTPQLTCDHAKHARHLFGLIHLNSPLSSGCVEQLKAIFALLEERNTQEWKENEELMRICKQGVDMEIDAALGSPSLDPPLERRHSDSCRTLVRPFASKSTLLEVYHRGADQVVQAGQWVLGANLQHEKRVRSGKE
jgi:hypothetical protein